MGKYSNKLPNSSNRLLKLINENGGLQFLEKCTHEVKDKSNIWLTGGKNMFMICLIKAYKTIEIN